VIVGVGVGVCDGAGVGVAVGVGVALGGSGVARGVTGGVGTAAEAAVGDAGARVKPGAVAMVAGRPGAGKSEQEADSAPSRASAKHCRRWRITPNAIADRRAGPS
jgi:hypothetical protein